MALTEYVVMPGADYQDICDSIREKTGSSTKVKSGDAGALIRSIVSGGEGGSGIPENFTMYKTGQFKPTNDTNGTTGITHNLGVTPNFFCIYAKNSSAPGSGYIVSGFGSKLAGTTGQAHYIHGTTSAKSMMYSCTESLFNLYASSGKYKAGVVYEWIVGVI